MKSMAIPYNRFPPDDPPLIHFFNAWLPMQELRVRRGSPEYTPTWLYAGKANQKRTSVCIHSNLRGDGRFTAEPTADTDIERRGGERRAAPGRVGRAHLRARAPPDQDSSAYGRTPCARRKQGAFGSFQC